MSKPKLNAMDAIKARVKQGGASSVHAQLIESDIIAEDRKENAKPAPETEKSTVYVNVNEPPKERRAKFEDNHTRHTVWIRNDLDKLIEDASGGRGDKTRIFNEALEQYLRKRKR
ncbi:hypothetical protein [Paenibacillus planticolens]|uniref:Uncharacterized protein n=1 Tax=Paenibacillus planticolens TaxID=2654976 RepID=A0ABX1ZE80_9BACL|nr:hypothetical protein [Paenibacillus planticolens]NOU98418.1 hypothetical protein [Paenibacillus planticolens]